MGIKKLCPVSIQIRQLELDIRHPRRFSLNLMRHRGFIFIVAATVVLASTPIHQHLFILLAPIATGLYTLGIWMVKQQRKRGGVASPLHTISLVQGRSASRQWRPRKNSSRINRKR